MMTRARLAFAALVAFALVLITSSIAAAGPWDGDSRTLTLAGPDGKAWLAGGVARVVLADGQAIATSDKRYKVTVADHLGRCVVTGADASGVLDWEIVVRPVDALSARIDLTITNRGKAPLTLERIEVLDAVLTGPADADRNRVLVSGDNSWSGGRVGRLEKGGKPVESHYTLAVQSPQLAAGFLAGRHNRDRFRLTAGQGGAGPRVLAWGECDKCLLPPGASRQADPLFVSGGDPLCGMELFADQAAKENGVQLWPENFATWCSWYAGWIGQHNKALYDYKGGLEKGTETNIPLVAKYLATRGAASMRVVDDSFDMPYGDWDNRTLAITKGFDRLADMMADRKIRAGVWYTPFWVSTKTRMFRQHPEMLCRDEDGQVHVDKGGVASSYGNFLAYLDASNPAAADHMEATARTWRGRGYRYVMTDFLMWGAWKGPRHDPSLTAVEAYRRGLAAMRSGFGKDTYWLHCGALLGPAMGMCDGMRISGDSHGAGTYSYISAGARWFYNWRVWINDPDAIVCARYGEAKSVEWNRAWMSWMALAGNVLTYGDTLDDLPAEDLKTYQRILPPLPRPGRPLDIFENDPFHVWGMDAAQADGAATLLGVFELQGRSAGRKISLNLDEAVARSQGWAARPKTCPTRRLVWDFWGEKLTVADAATLTLDLPERGCRVLSVRPDLGRPQLVGTSGHFSQGLLEVTDVKWNRRGELTASVRGNGGEATTLFYYIPAGMKCTGVSVDFAEQPVKLTDQGVLVVEVGPVKGQPVAMELRFSGQAGKVETRPFEPGRVATVSEGK